MLVIDACIDDPDDNAPTIDTVLVSGLWGKDKWPTDVEMGGQSSAEREPSQLWLLGKCGEL
jgi:hypothetical protein